VDLGRLKPFLWPALALAALLVGVALGLLLRAASVPGPPDPERIAAAALLSVREQGRIAVHSARFVAIVSARRNRFGLAAERTLIVPGEARYEVDLARLSRDRLTWDATTSTLTVTLPPLEVTGPNVDWSQAREQGDGGILVALTDAGREMDAANRQAAQSDLVRQARDEAVLRLAREAALRAVARGFAMPLRAAGIDASVAARFVDPSGTEQATYLDRRHAIEDAVTTRNSR
jgi:hypothetical protein